MHNWYREHIVPNGLANSAVNNSMLWLAARAGDVQTVLFLYGIMHRGRFTIEGQVLAGAFSFTFLF